MPVTEASWKSGGMSRAMQPMDEAVALLGPVDRLGLGLGPAHPTALMHALDGRTDFTDLTIYGALLTDLFDIFTRSGVHHQSGFFGPAERVLIASGADVQFVPADFRRFAPALERVAPRVVRPRPRPGPTPTGTCSLLTRMRGATWGEVKRAAADPNRVLIVEVNEALPHTLGVGSDHPHRLHVDEIDVLVAGDRPLYSLVDPEPTDVDRAIAAHARPIIVDGSTLQTGIGSIPSTIISLLATEHDGGGYGVHSEMFTTGLMQLHQAGKVTNDAKGIYEGFSVTTFALGSTELYQWLDGNPDVRFLPASIVNSPDVIAQNRRMVTINGAIQIDLYGQAVADTINGKQYSGIGGHEDFVASSGLQLEDRSLVCLPSTVTVGGDVLSRIVPTLAAGAVVTTPRHQLDVVITEHGVAELRGRTVRERALALAAVAAPGPIARV